jgi:hypothetical protein
MAREIAAQVTDRYELVHTTLRSEEFAFPTAVALGGRLLSAFEVLCADGQPPVSPAGGKDRELA